MGHSQDTEITLGTGRMLALFFALVVICGAFFGLGYSLGRSSTKPVEEAKDQHSASKTDLQMPQAKTTPARATSAENLTFFQTVKQNEAAPQPIPTTNDPQPKKPAAPVNSSNSSEQAPLTGILNSGGYMVQVAAVTKKEDADALVSALRKKSYPVVQPSNESRDKLYHVQLGPFADIKDAEAMKAKLISDGYNPILKK
jgi:cell division septation protein DedD